MKKTLYVLTMLMALAWVGCNRMRPKTDHSKKMPKVALPVDSAQKNDIKETTKDESWKKEPAVEIPETPKEKVGKPNVAAAERMLSGK